MLYFLYIYGSSRICSTLYGLLGILVWWTFFYSFIFKFQIKNEIGADVAKWIKAVDCESTMRGFNSRRSPAGTKLLLFLFPPLC